MVCTCCLIDFYQLVITIIQCKANLSCKYSQFALNGTICS